MFWTQIQFLLLFFFFLIAALWNSDQCNVIQHMKKPGLSLPTFSVLGAGPGFPTGGMDLTWGRGVDLRHRCFTVKMCENQRIGSRRGGMHWKILFVDQPMSLPAEIWNLAQLKWQICRGLPSSNGKTWIRPWLDLGGVTHEVICQVWKFLGTSLFYPEKSDLKSSPFYDFCCVYYYIWLRQTLESSISRLRSAKTIK